MAKLGYTWYPENWWTSDEFFDLEDHPLVRYVYREIIDLLYTKNGNANIDLKIIWKRFRVKLDNSEFDMLKSLFVIESDNVWSHPKISKRLTKAESARENGKKGGRPKTKNPKTQDKNPKENPNKPTLERESERESKSKREYKENKEGEKQNSFFENIKRLRKTKPNDQMGFIGLAFHKMEEYLPPYGWREEDHESLKLLEQIITMRLESANPEMKVKVPDKIKVLEAGMKFVKMSKQDPKFSWHDKNVKSIVENFNQILNEAKNNGVSIR